MQTVDQKKVRRIVDANFNRAKEGLRVCEDICRFVYNKRGATQQYKRLRHQLSAAIVSLKISDMIRARDIEGDVGTRSIRVELSRKNINDIFYANAQRIKESLRVLEEFSKLLKPKRTPEIKKLRYKAYALEKEVVKRF